MKRTGIDQAAEWLLPRLYHPLVPRPSRGGRSDRHGSAAAVAGEAHALILACETQRERLVVLGLIETGLPADEFSRLTSGDVNWPNATVCAPGTTLTIPVSAELLRLLREHFDNATSLGIGNRQIQRIVRRVGRRAGLKKDISPDILRRTRFWNSVSIEANEGGSRVLLEAANAALDVILIADDERRYVDLNRAASEALGLPREAIIGRRIEEFFSDTRR